MSGNISAQQFRLIEAARPFLAPMQRDRHDNVEALIYRESPLQIPRQRAPQRLHPRILEKVDQAAQRAIVKSETDRIVETTQAGPASRAYSMLIQRVAV